MLSIGSLKNTYSEYFTYILMLCSSTQIPFMFISIRLKASKTTITLGLEQASILVCWTWDCYSKLSSSPPVETQSAQSHYLEYIVILIHASELKYSNMNILTLESRTPGILTTFGLLCLRPSNIIFSSISISFKKAVPLLNISTRERKINDR